MSEKLTYTDSGVNIEEGARAVDLMKGYVKNTFTKNVLCDLGGFGGLFQLDAKAYEEPVLVSGTDGVGTKLKLAFMMDKHDTVGIDLVAMCVNDILCQGAKPLFFLDYIATGKLKAEKVADIVKGISEGCMQSGSALIGGETAEMPGFYDEGEYDMAGFSVGIVDKHKIIDGSKIQDGDVVVGLPSSGIHSNGYSLVRKLFFDKLGYGVDKYIEELGETLGETLLRPTKIYADIVMKVLKEYEIGGMVHITGGGFYENIPRIIPDGLGVEINLGSWKVLPIFQLMQREGNIEIEEMFKTFNMGIGYILIVKEKDTDEMLGFINDNGEEAYRIGTVVKGIHGVSLCQ
ncbi:phosphoribosylformylglycinamidine cyclo-ligase [Paramaledivibacter caminithermalis]|jgi:phosphoribosylformylglycinamidine cyclo-ligase|uniref:Phosphoribosylformylglycinamidine cyclo-ligase n=1 Tax=Paramaledivibacter caminithermalis (strain DSM 15212 / CIP 107654 / DViRD3) TaxID=1121301 RepID=A0A1M6QIZ1_PARC5|nr:phosphoribosylformylglycinamidine cyclo-ligase [Paramaledivibacter caminithermalis]SHK20274.1 phosphoribosylformylglycinamidine cyclo-ligase [Paramaledivibacter caminithermalis DSM 15212]